MRKNDIKVLSERDHVRQKPGMYVGDITLSPHNRWGVFDDKIEKCNINIVPAFLKLFDEIISNSIDEYLRTDGRHANLIKVKIDGDKISIEDNGRGISSEFDEEHGKTKAELAFTNLRAGANFGEDDFVSIGTHGLGASLVNIMSHRFTVMTDNNVDRTYIKCKDGMLHCDSQVTASNGNVGTKVTYTPDYELFKMSGLDDTHIMMIEKRVMDLAVCYPKIQFKLNGRLIKSRVFKNYLNMIDPVFEFIETDHYKIAVLPSDAGDQISFLNGIETFRGGSHIDYVSMLINNALRDKINKKHKLNIKPFDIKSKFIFVLITNEIPGLKWESQTKERMTLEISKFKDLFADLEDNDKWFNKIMRNEDLIMPIIEAQLLKKQLAEARELRKKLKDTHRKKVISHVQAKGGGNILFLTEGQSAIGNLIKVRDPKIHGGYPLKGKVKNTYGMKLTDIVKNKELSDVMNILGLNLGEPVTTMNYDYIGILTDQDEDGHHIKMLLIGFFAHWKELFTHHKIRIYNSPLMIAKKGGEVKYLYNLKEIGNEDLSGWSKKYAKGLGSLSASEYRDIINTDDYDVITHDDINDPKALHLALGDEAQLRKDWLLA